ncbi:MAG: hypothetical protein JWN70_6179 [Planctomycetaceae bacterium]|nr:hypothetical protein [Planctomycetaceae bacterium]
MYIESSGADGGLAMFVLIHTVDSQRFRAASASEHPGFHFLRHD